MNFANIGTDFANRETAPTDEAPMRSEAGLTWGSLSGKQVAV